MKLSVIIPAYNEGKHIRANLIAVSEAFIGISDEVEVLVVDDGSTDNTKDEILSVTKDHSDIIYAGYDTNRGKGGAIKHGVEKATGDVIAFLDADLDLSPKHIVDYYAHMKNTNCDIVIGSKMHKDSKLDYPPARKFFSWCYFAMLKILFGLSIKDTQTGVKMYKAEYIKKVTPLLRVSGYAFDIEILALCNHEGAKIDEMPVEIIFRREESFGRIKFKDIWKMFIDTFGIWWNLRVVRSYFK
ncbi:MAG: glycosyltransferase [Saccharofermentans sp.]|nr:glycosyltransferase [Saccharofermentans sp.]